MDTVFAIAFPAALLVAYLTTRPAPQSREFARRARRVSRHPALVNLGDVQARLVADLPAPYAAFARERISFHRIGAQTAWAWLERYDAQSLVVFLAAGHGHSAMLEVLGGAKGYDDAALRVVAGRKEPALFELAA
ncbi:hypothetical protein ASC77_17920 [Nocardioides sp. Root1257]|uniref:hypothetical protein n=1 Tax=unclassified Nocardioides TaxID=2615069 RepID=UPI0006F7A6B8|nr:MULTISPECIES: hypothetical protein [unclassified Nocardioides]KQW47062.1 hypothetical protein ASC77_17920 [Nocardioides sp. Root1257]KRC43807.1 hypothetical protein ASE24_18875 [Nocardioides sp. Root224]